MTSAESEPGVARLRHALAEYDPGSSVVELDRLVARLSSLIDALVGLVDEEWREELRSSWWRLEHVNALALGGDRYELGEAEVDAVRSACDELDAALVRY